jgi:hypothetical protein
MPVHLLQRLTRNNAHLLFHSGTARSFVRPSGTEDVVRVYAEAASPSAADELAAQVHFPPHCYLCNRFSGSDSSECVMCSQVGRALYDAAGGRGARP